MGGSCESVNHGRRRSPFGNRDNHDARLDSHSDELAAVLGNTCALAGDLGGVDEVLEDLLVDGGEGSGSGSLLLRGGRRVSLRLGEHSALRQEDDVFVRQLLLELSREPVGGDDGGIGMVINGRCELALLSGSSRRGRNGSM